MKFKNVFVLCTGRCGSTTIVKAMAHARNYTAGHETRAHLLGEDRLAYPKGHFEADNRLSWFLGRLERTFGPKPFYVHLTRAVEDVVRSHIARSEYGIMRAYRNNIILKAVKLNPDATLEDFATDYVETVTDNITAFLRDKPHVMHFRLEEAETHFPLMWERIGAKGDLDAAMQEWTIRYNASRDQDL